MKPQDMRRNYDQAELAEADIAATPHVQFARWLSDAVAAELPDPNAMVLSTADAGGRPSSRTVLLKDFDEAGFSFFTNLTSRKGRELAANAHVSLCFPWYVLERQVIVVGVARLLDRAAVDAYFAIRPRGSQVGAWASAQSTTVRGRDELQEAYAAAERRFPDAVPTPPHWGGFVVEPQTVEFWQGRPSRMHDRLRYVRGAADGKWRVERLAP